MLKNADPNIISYDEVRSPKNRNMGLQISYNEIEINNNFKSTEVELMKMVQSMLMKDPNERKCFYEYCADIETHYGSYINHIKSELDQYEMRIRNSSSYFSQFDENELDLLNENKYKSFQELKRGQNPYSHYYLGSLFFFGNIVPNNYVSSYRHFKQFMNTRNPTSFYFIEQIHKKANEIENNNRNEDGVFFTGIINEANNKIYKAIGNYIQSFKKSKHPMIAGRLGKLLLKCGREKNDEKLIEEGVKLLVIGSNKGDFYSMLKLAKYLVEMDPQSEPALKLFETLLNEDKYPDAAYKIGLIYKKRNEETKGNEYIQKAKEYYFTNVE